LSLRPILPRRRSSSLVSAVDAANLKPLLDDSVPLQDDPDPPTESEIQQQQSDDGKLEYDLECKSLEVILRIDERVQNGLNNLDPLVERAATVVETELSRKSAINSNGVA
jgi:hypothetical protein